MASPTRWTWVWVNPGVGDGQRGLVCCSSWGRKESDVTEQLNWTELNHSKKRKYETGFSINYLSWVATQCWTGYPKTQWDTQFSSVQSLNRVQLFVIPWTVAHQASLYINNSWNLLKLMSIELVMPSNHLILCHPFLPLPSICLSIRVFSNESILRIRWPKDWSFSFNISPTNEHPGLITFREDGLVGSPCRPRDSQGSSPTPQLNSINSLVLSLLYSPTLTSICDYWKNHNFD